MNATGFSRNLRLLTPQHYDLVFKETQDRFTSKHLLLLTRKNNLSYPRLGLAISKKRAPLAISRNHIKRHAREIFRLHQCALKGYDYIFLLKRNISKKDALSIESEFSYILTQILANRA